MTRSSPLTMTHRHRGPGAVSLYVKKLSDINGYLRPPAGRGELVAVTEGVWVKIFQMNYGMSLGMSQDCVYLQQTNHGLRWARLRARLRLRRILENAVVLWWARLGLCDMTIYFVGRYKNVYLFILCSIVYFVLSQITVFTVIFVVIWTALYILPHGT